MSDQPISAEPPSESTPSDDSHTNAAPALLATPLIDFHHELGARIVDFAGWALPVHYDGAIAETKQCRRSAALFDVSHMGVVDLRGPNVAEALEAITPAGIATLQPGRMRYALLTNAAGGIIDDMMVTRPPTDTDGTHFVAVVNGARRSVDLPHLRATLPGIDVVERQPYALLAVQGPAAVTALARLSPGIERLVFMDAGRTELGGVPVEVSRSGYTGDDGFELVIPAGDAVAVARLLLAQPEIEPAGLGARDALRLEAGLCLYGHDLDETTSPVEADLVWSIPKRRREAGGFLGADRIQAELEAGPSRVRVGLAPQGKRPVRDGAVLRTADGTTVGVVTSGGYGPTVERPIAMGYVTPEISTIGTTVVADVRGNEVACIVAHLPFVPPRYVRGA